jgi:hypothetical protein
MQMNTVTNKMRRTIAGHDAIWLPTPSGERVLISVPAGTPIDFGIADARPSALAAA